MPKKIAIMVALVVMVVPLVAAAAFAADQIIHCNAAPCYGSGNDDKIYEIPRNGAFDKIIMKGAMTSYSPTVTPTTPI